jgi:hypothetical protein
MILLLPLLFLLVSGNDRCATAQISFSQPVITTEKTIGIFALVSNCGDKSVRLETETEIETACSEMIELGDNYSRVGPGQGFYANGSYTPLPDACTGTYRVRVIVLSGRTVVGNGEAEFVVN